MCARRGAVSCRRGVSRELGKLLQSLAVDQRRTGRAGKD
jgi:hypothetical protein